MQQGALLMSKYRRTHQSNRGSGLRLGVLIALLTIVVASLLLVRSMLHNASQPQLSYSGPEILAEYMPASDQGQTVHHRHFSLSYLEKYEQAQWVAYELTREELDAPRVSRHDRFNPDYSVTTRSAFSRDYSGSGFTRGHLAPAADMAFDTLAMRESFYMSNISPQRRDFNNGIWRELEEQTRDWARASGRLYIVTGPVLSTSLTSHIGQNKVAVPELFYKVLLDPDEPEIRNVAFLLPNALSDKPLMEYAVSIDSVEHITGLDFFPLHNGTTDEGKSDISRWPLDTQRYQKRIKEWNNE